MKIESLSIEHLIPYALNSRTHSDEQIGQVAASIAEYGFTNPVLIDQDDGIIAGHGRVMAAKLLKMSKVPCIRLSHLSETQKRAYIIADNKLALNAGWDETILAMELKEIGEVNFDLSLTGFDTDDIDELIAALDASSDGDTSVDDIPEPPKEPITKNGDVWLLGRHRIMCGDAGEKTDLARLMGGEIAKLVVTDPPYGVAYVGKTKDRLTVENDSVSPEVLKEYCEKWFDGVDAVLADGGYVLATVPPGPLHIIFADDWHRRGWLRQILVWNKDSMVLGHSEYHYKHEPILFGWKPGDRLKNPDRTRTTVWDFKRPKSSREHPTMKPLEMWRFAIENHSRAGWLLYEPFSGSGTTIIAAEQTGRRCYAMEVSPIYVDVAIKRWEEYTGKTAVLESNKPAIQAERVGENKLLMSEIALP